VTVALLPKRLAYPLPYLRYSSRHPAVAALADGAAIATLPDLRGHADASQATAGSRPTRQTVNGIPVVRFAGVDDFLSTAAIDFSANTQLTVALILSSDATATLYSVYESANPSVNNDAWSIHLAATTHVPTAFVRGDSGFSAQAHSLGVTTTPRMLFATLDRAAATNEATIYLDGFPSTVARSPNLNNTNTFGNRATFIGARDGTSNFLIGDLYELWVWRRILTSDELYAWGRLIAGPLNVARAWRLSLVPSDFSDATFAEPLASRPMVNGLGRVVVTTDARFYQITSETTIYARYPALADIGLDDSSAKNELAHTADGVVTFSGTLPAGSKTIRVVSGGQSKPTDLGYRLGTWPKIIALGSSVAPAILHPHANHLTVYGDSIPSGANSGGTKDGWVERLREAREANDASTTTLIGWGYRALYDDANTSQLRAALVAEFVTSNPAIIWLEIGTNDYGLAPWTAAAFGTAYAALLDDLHAALPSAVIYCQSPIDRVSPAVETANAVGSTMANYRTQISNAASARSGYCTYVTGVGMVSAGNYDTDGVHPLTTGHTQILAAVKTALGVP
jgi:lysophospholipase L1-like esterase